MKKHGLTIVWILTMLLTACASVKTSDEAIPQITVVPQETQSAAQVPATQPSTPLPTATPQQPDASTDCTLDALEALLGMEGAQAAQCFGGAAENWTADQRYFIDYTYDIALNGKEVKVHATCDSAQIVNALSIQLTDGTAVVEEAEALAWVADITAHAGNTPVYDDTTSEAGSIIWTWRLDDKTLTLYKTGDVMSLSIVPAQEAAQ